MKSKYPILVILGILLIIAVVFIFNMRHKNLPVEITQIDVAPYTNPSMDKDKYLVPDGEYTGSVGSVLRIDDIYVDDQYYAFTEISSLNEGKLIQLELSNEVKILLLLNSANATKHLEPVALDVFRKIMRAEAKSSSGFSRVFKLKIKDGLIFEIIEIESEEKFKASSDQEQELLSNTNILTGYKWVWTETHRGTGPHSSDGGKIFPKKPNSFALLFDKDGKFSVITDCNIYNGDFNIEKGMIDFTFLDSTKKICPESQEKEFISMLVKSSLGIGDDFIVFENSQSIILKKEAK